MLRRNQSNQIVTNLDSMANCQEKDSKWRIEIENKNSNEARIDRSPRFFLIEQNFRSNCDVGNDGGKKTDCHADESRIASQEISDKDCDTANDGGQEESESVLRSWFPLSEKGEDVVVTSDDVGSVRSGSAVLENHDDNQSGEAEKLREETEVQDTDVLSDVLAESVELGEKENEVNNLNDAETTEREDALHTVRKEGNEERTATEEESAFIDRNEAVSPNHDAARKVDGVCHVEKNTQEHLDDDSICDALEEECGENENRKRESD
jgi:hypothetical protein